MRPSKMAKGSLKDRKFAMKVNLNPFKHKAYVVYVYDNLNLLKQKWNFKRIEGYSFVYYPLGIDHGKDIVIAKPLCGQWEVYCTRVYEEYARMILFRVFCERNNNLSTLKYLIEFHMEQVEMWISENQY